MGVVRCQVVELQIRATRRLAFDAALNRNIPIASRFSGAWGIGRAVGQQIPSDAMRDDPVGRFAAPRVFKSPIARQVLCAWEVRRIELAGRGLGRDPLIEAFDCNALTRLVNSTAKARLRSGSSRTCGAMPVSHTRLFERSSGTRSTRHPRRTRSPRQLHQRLDSVSPPGPDQQGRS